MRGVWLYLNLVVDVWSRKVVAWDVAEVESAAIAAELVQRACMKERYRSPRGFGANQPPQAAADPQVFGLLMTHSHAQIHCCHEDLGRSEFVCGEVEGGGCAQQAPSVPSRRFASKVAAASRELNPPWRSS